MKSSVLLDKYIIYLSSEFGEVNKRLNVNQRWERTCRLFFWQLQGSFRDIIDFSIFSPENLLKEKLFKRFKVCRQNFYFRWKSLCVLWRLWCGRSGADLGQFYFPLPGLLVRKLILNSILFHFIQCFLDSAFWLAENFIRHKTGHIGLHQEQIHTFLNWHSGTPSWNII